MKFTSDLSEKEFPVREKIRASLINDAVFNSIQQHYPGFDKNSVLSLHELNACHAKYITSGLKDKNGFTDAMDQKVANAVQQKDFISDNPDDDDQESTFGQRVADKVAAFGGSWTFIISFVIFLLAWIGINVFMLGDKGWDPYPFILLNLILSCIAALQAPVIMMSQNRQSEKDRKKADNDYMVNLKSELEVRLLNDKIDHLIMQQEQALTDMQEQHKNLMLDIVNRLDK